MYSTSAISQPRPPSSEAPALTDGSPNEKPPSNPSQRPDSPSSKTPPTNSKRERITIGTADNFWTWSPSEGWDLTHPPTPSSPPISPRISLPCEISNIRIDPAKTALLIIDMQNISLSNISSPTPAMQAAEHALLTHAIPAARILNLQLIWLNWGLTELELQNMTPAELRTFGFKANSSAPDYGLSQRRGNPTSPRNFLSCGEHARPQHFPGADLGRVRLQDGNEVEAGRKMLLGTWNAALHAPLLAAYDEGQKTARPDVLIHKSKNSGLWDSKSARAEFLKVNGIRTLLFAGVNTDQCVMATLQDAHARGFDTILLKDACATDSPGYAQEAVEYNLCRNWGFLSSCGALAGAAGV